MQAEPPSSLSRLAFATCALSILGALLVLAVGGPAGDDAARLVASLGVASTAWVAAVVLAARGHGDLRLVVAVAVAMRILAFAGGPSLSDDVYRYAWEGELVANGRSPYAFAPDDPALSDLRDRLPEVAGRVNHPSVSAAYPPVTQYANAAVVAFAHAGRDRPGLAGVTALRVVYGSCDLLVLVPLVALLRRRGRPVALAVAWGWSPLLALEFAGSGHFDALGVLVLLAALLAFGRAPRGALGTVLLAVATLVKFLPVVALPFAITPGRPGRVAVRVALFAAVVGVAYLPLLALEGGAAGWFTGLAQYGTRWEGGSLVFRWVDGAVRGLPDVTGLGPQRTARAIVALVWLGAAVHAARRRLDALDATGFLLGWFLVLAPNLHPWYFAWIVPFVALRPSRAWLWLLAAAPVLYWPVEGWRARAEWVEPAWVWPVVALPFFALLAADRLRRTERP